MSGDGFLTRWWNHCRSNSKSEHKGGTLSLWNSGRKAEQNSQLQRWWWRKEEAAEQGKIHSLWSFICGKSKHVPVTEAVAFTVGGIIIPKVVLCEYCYVWISSSTWLTACHDKSKILLISTQSSDLNRALAAPCFLYEYLIRACRSLSAQTTIAR